jgi:hypothetical protein
MWNQDPSRLPNEINVRRIGSPSAMNSINAKIWDSYSVAKNECILQRCGIYFIE